ncbi:MAG TPA: cytochrome b/b6 domain-containing protein [Candidatus Limnocylindrales bacterium]|nr:cytochrome b/b6 domain-containing protein [Candidatus Limnocylindrales bacterium]
MAESAYLQGLTIQDSDVLDVPRHSALVRITHWIAAVSFFGLLVSGIAILLAHPRLYWGETGARGGPSLIDLPLPFVLELPIRGPGRYLHFLCAWIAVFTGMVYVIAGLISRHLSRHLLPGRSQLHWKEIRRVILDHLRFKRPPKEEALTYNFLQRIAYLVVIFVVFPLMIWTGLAMSPAITSVFPTIVTFWGGQQSARTIHFFASCFLILFLLIHVTMICLAGFVARVRAMITGHVDIAEEGK